MTAATGHRPLTGHDHEHGETCGHASVRHGDHLDYVHDGAAAGGCTTHVPAGEILGSTTSGVS